MAQGIKAVLTLLVLSVTAISSADELTIVAYNVESDGAKPATIAGEIEQVPGVDIWAFSEVLSRAWLQQFSKAAERADGGSSYRYEIGTTGVYDNPRRGPDYLGFVYDVGRLRLSDHYELHQIDDGSHRAPLVADFVVRETGSRFLLVVNHLASGDEDYRAEQTALLREWARDHASVPVIMIGDFNYRLNTSSSPLNEPGDLQDLTRGGHLQWIQPSPLGRTWCGKFGGKRDWMFDFAFVNALAGGGNPRSDVLSTYCKKRSSRASDHRPIRLRLSLTEPSPLPSPGFAAAAAEPVTRAAPTTVILVRHADVPPGHSEQSTSLTSAGRERAASLVRLATDAGVTALYATEYCRTVQTAQPLAVALGLPVFVPYVGQPQALSWLDNCTPAIDADGLVASMELPGDDPQQLVQRILARHPGETVAVVGHSNTVPDLIDAFGMQCSDCQIAEREFDSVFVLRVSESAPPTLVRARYGPCPCN